MFHELITDARLAELDADERKITQRLEWARINKIERLERELAVARARLQAMSPLRAL
jgi:hypothetical protein